MRILTVTANEVAAASVHLLGLEEEAVALDYPEAICASLRRAASFLCPTTPRAIVDMVLEALTPVLPEPPTRDDLMTVVDQLISSGDLLELTETASGRTARLLFLGPPSFIERSVGRYLLTGIRPRGMPLVNDEFIVEYEGHTRTAILDPTGAEISLRAAGLHKVSPAQWIGQPSTVSAVNYLEQYGQRLSAARAAGFVDGLTIIDPTTRPTYYRGRWRTPATGDTGDFVGRRPQAYGADLWCFVRLMDGAPDRMLDLPVDNVLVPARDDAWRLQAAIDALRGTPLDYRVRIIPGSKPAEEVVDLFSPLPSWAERYLGLIGLPVEKSRGALFSYRLPASAREGLESVLIGTLWMNAVAEGNSQ